MSRSKRTKRTKVYIVCTGLGRVKRGFETLARELFDHLQEDGRLEVHLLKGGGESSPTEQVVPNIYRDSWLNHALCTVLGRRRRYYVEFLSFCMAMGPIILLGRPDVVFTLEEPINKFLVKWRSWTRADYRLVQSTTGQLVNVPAEPRNFIHHVTPTYVPRANDLGFGSKQQFLIPQFIDLHTVPEPLGGAEKRVVRRRLGLPEDREILLSVGNLDKGVKRMDYVVREVAALPEAQRPYLLMLGHVDPDTEEIRALARELLGEGNFRIGSVPRSEIWDFYRSADVFALGSLCEGFGFVYIEALASGLPVIAHDYETTRFVLGDQGLYADLRQTGALAEVLRAGTWRGDQPDHSHQRRQYVRERFDWSAVGDPFIAMFETAARA